MRCMVAQADRRKSDRLPLNGLVTLFVVDGPYHWSHFAAFLTDIDPSGIGLELDAGHFARGTAVCVIAEDGLEVSGWIAHSRESEGLTTLGISLEPMADIQTLVTPAYRSAS